MAYFYSRTPKARTSTGTVEHFLIIECTECCCQIWQAILQESKGGKGIKFTQKAVRYHWAQVSCNVWRCAEDPIESAREYCQQCGPEEDIKEVEMLPVPGSQAFAFVVKDFMAGWAQHTDAFLVDSTCT